MQRNIRLYPWFRFFQNLTFWQAVWFLYFQAQLSAAEAILLYAIYDVATTAMEVPSGYMSDRLGRRITLIASAIAGIAATLLLGLGSGFAVFAVAQMLLGVNAAFLSGTDSALLFESLVAEGRGDEIEAEELKAWRFGFTGLALSAVSGGMMALWSGAWPFLAGAVAFCGVLVAALAFREPPHPQVEVTAALRFAGLRSALVDPVLMWLFGLSVLMYLFSHIPFVFGQPFILEALQGQGWDGEAPLVSGSVSAMMMVVSVLVSYVALSLRDRLGLPILLLCAFGMQIGLIAVLAVTNSWVAIAFLFLRMVPNSLSRPFIVARIQPVLSNESRATYMSLQSFAGRLLFAGTLFLASSGTGEGVMGYPEIRVILGWYCLAGMVCLLGLLFWVRKIEL